ncbi:type II secretion system F family protein [Halodesulfovibrio aestuarii]|uniref:Type II secretory pathway, component PulF n=1 Tax=Halodesulfovibrio aestuarii TaxID=126333 RepID=A0A8G2C9A6_9BACT|nr:type II secretion system F family protein [Halodesulfovibrio aestuarii]SHJ06438.1 Type II secretory pathway, component PulF [Halodesulfovibrio aestuarii]
MFAKADRLRIIAALFFSGKKRCKFYQKLAAMTENGLGLNDALESMQRRLERKHDPQHLLLSEALVRTQSGDSLADAFHGFIPDAEYMLIKSGVDGGDLPNALELTCGLIDAKEKIVSAIVQALSYPVLLCSLLMVFLLVLSHYVVPQLSLIVDPESWRGGAAILYSVAVFISSPTGVLFLISTFGAVVLSMATLPHFTGKLRIKCDKLPPWSLYRLIHGSIWLFTLATMLKANVQLSVVLDDMLESSKRNRWMSERIQAIRAQLNLGKSLGEALDDSGFNFPDEELVEDMLIYSTLPGFDSRLYTIAKQWLEQGIDRIKAQCKALNFGLLIAILTTLCGIALAVSSLQQQLGQSMTL